MNDIKTYSDETFRKLYVGITRAKNNLYIHCNGDFFRKYKSTTWILKRRTNNCNNYA